MIVDTHVHIWNLDRAKYPWLEGDASILNRNYDLEQIGTERLDAGITSGVLVQASGNLEDTELMLEAADKTSWINGVVAWLPLMNVKVTQQLLEERFLKEKYFKGVRHQIHDEQDAKWMLQPSVIESLQLLALHDIPYDVVAVLPAHIETALKVAEQVPGLRMVFDHLSQPPIATKEKFGLWGQLMKTAAQHKNFYAKISGLGTASGHFNGRTASDIKPYVEFTLLHFGVDRCFCGGDWPVSLLSDNYAGTWKTNKDIVQELVAEPDQHKVFYSNAREFYNLSIS